MKLYKFKSLKGDGLLHSLDMIVNERIYVTTCNFMNDPHEGGWYQEEHLSTLCNSDADDYTRQAEELYSIIHKTKYTCFTKCFKNTLLWAHYAGGRGLGSNLIY
jgi:predicted cupin superfamily sugar epimerase